MENNTTIKTAQAPVPAAAPSAITIHPETNSESTNSSRMSRGLILAIVIALILGIIGVSSLLNAGSSKSYKGMIQKVKLETSTLEKKIQR